MKLRNKKTGEVRIYRLQKVTGEQKEYDSLAEFTEEWEDYEEPQSYWYYDTISNDVEETHTLVDIKKDKGIGNYFETKEEAEKAVEKLKAWKRLKDAGLKFGRWDGYVNAGNSIESGDHFACCGFVNAYGQIYNNQDSYEQYRKDLDLLFGGEE